MTVPLGTSNKRCSFVSSSTLFASTSQSRYTPEKPTTISGAYSARTSQRSKDYTFIVSQTLQSWLKSYLGISQIAGSASLVRGHTVALEVHGTRLTCERLAAGVATYTSNLNTAAVIRKLAGASEERTSTVLRLLLETDSPYMLPTNLPVKEMGIKSARSLPTSHSGMLPYTAQFIAETTGNGWTTEEVIRACRENATKMYGV